MLQWLRESFVEEYTTKGGEKKPRPGRRGAGCRKLMLPESENALRKVIAYYEKTGKIMPWAPQVEQPLR